MAKFHLLLAVFFLARDLPAQAQAISNTVAWRNIPGDQYTRINYENDFFSGTDRDYTQGVLVECVNPSFRNFFLSKLLWKPGTGSRKDGIALENDGYTPNYLDRTSIQKGDRPYAGVMMFKTFTTVTDPVRRSRVSTVLGIGVIGPWAREKAIQTGIHHWIHYTKPLGWGNQVSNDLALTYELNYEKEFFTVRNNVSLSASGTARLGSLSTKATFGLTGMVGNFSSPFDETEKRSTCLQYYFYAVPSLSFIGYDATLQGGLFNRSSPYTIPANQVTRITTIIRWGFVVQLRHLSFEYFQSGPTQEFSTSVYHRSGGLQVGFGF